MTRDDVPGCKNACCIRMEYLSRHIMWSDKCKIQIRFLHKARIYAICLQSTLENKIEAPMLSELKERARMCIFEKLYDNVGGENT